MASHGFHVKSGVRFAGWLRAQDIVGANPNTAFVITNKDGHLSLNKADQEKNISFTLRKCPLASLLVDFVINDLMLQMTMSW